ncbi:MAG TPA: zinc ribbon domain-containing protein [Thermoanaerobaculia bacterium]|nr:zinc ribbon domain-containing protein [Thermoanaerobaculia bacterium]
MPLYEFTCEKCGATFEELVGAGLDGFGVTCPECGSEEIEKLVSRFASAGASTSNGGGGGGGSCGPGSGRFT